MPDIVRSLTDSLSLDHSLPAFRFMGTLGYYIGNVRGKVSNFGYLNLPLTSPYYSFTPSATGTYISRLRVIGLEAGTIDQLRGVSVIDSISHDEKPTRFGVFKYPDNHPFIAQLGYYYLKNSVVEVSVADTITLSDEVLRERVVDQSLTSTLSLSHSVTMFRSYSLSHSLSLTDTVVGVKVHSESLTDSLTITDEARTPTAQRVNNDLTLTDDVDVTVVWVRSLTDTLSLTDSAVGSRLYEKTITDTLSLTDTGIGVKDVTKSLSHTLSLTDSVTTDIGKLITQSLSLSQSVSVGKDHEESLHHDIHLTQSVDSNIKWQSVVNTLHLTQSVIWEIPTFAISASSDLSLFDEVSTSGSSYSRSLLDQISLVQIVEIPVEASASSTISLTQSVRGNRGNDQTLTITDAASYSLGKGLTQSLNLTQVAVANVVRSRSLSHSLTLGQSARTDRVASDVLYAPEKQPGVTFPALPTIVHQGQITLSYPYISSLFHLTVIALRNPKLEDTVVDRRRRIVRETRGGSLRIFRRVNWSKSTRLKYDIEFLKKEDLDALEAFLLESLGKEVKLIDYNNQEWKVVIGNPNTALTQAGRQNRTVTLEFEGDLVEA